MNELCQFTGAFCNSLHCDEMGYLCRVPYLLTCIKNGQQRNDYITCGKATSDRDDIPGQETPSTEIPAEDDTGYLPEQAAAVFVHFIALRKRASHT